MTMRTGLKRRLRQAGEGITAALAPMLWRIHRGPALVVLMYHRILPRSDARWRSEQPGMRVSPESFDLHLRVLREHFQLVHLDDWLTARDSGGSLPRRACALTFDDGWRDNFEYAFPLLKQHRVPATVFLVSDFVGGSYSFWPNRLVRAIHALPGADALSRLPLRLVSAIESVLAGERDTWPLGEDAIDRIIGECKRRFTDAEMYLLLDDAGPIRARSLRDLMDWSEIAAMAASGLVRFGSHTCRHTRLLPALQDDTVSDEICRSRQAIERQIGGQVRLFCYPNGDASDAAQRLVRQHYEGAVLTERGWNSAATDSFRIRRIGLHEDISGTTTALLARVAGLP